MALSLHTRDVNHLGWNMHRPGAFEGMLDISSEQEGGSRVFRVVLKCESQAEGVVRQANVCGKKRGLWTAK